MTKNIAIILLGLLGAIAACSKKDGGGGDQAAAKPTAEAPAAAAKLAFKKLGTLPVEAEVPEDANIEDGSKGAGFPMVTVYASPTTFVTGAGEMSDLKPTIEETKAQLAKDPNKLKAITREQKTADGWIIELTRESMLDPKDVLYGVSVRHTLAGAAWDCGTNAKSKEELASAEKLCTSLRAAK